jgi:hypothetical protein
MFAFWPFHARSPELALVLRATDRTLRQIEERISHSPPPAQALMRKDRAVFPSKRHCQRECAF